MKQIITGLLFAALLTAVGLSTYARFVISPELTEPQFFMTYWRWYVGLGVPLTAAALLVAKYARKR